MGLLWDLQSWEDSLDWMMAMPVQSETDARRSGTEAAC